jgi:hypothetical protein
LSLLASAPAQAEISRFFASPEACRGSGVFSPADCAAAFARAADLMRERAPHFSDRIECVLAFKACVRQERQDGPYLPAMLGVEMIKGRGGAIARPALAVETPEGLFRDPTPKPEPRVAVAPRPISRPVSSPYGDLAGEASAPAPSGPPTLASYRRLFEASHPRRLAAKPSGGSGSEAAPWGR